MLFLLKNCIVEINHVRTYLNETKNYSLHKVSVTLLHFVVVVNCLHVLASV